MSETDELCNLNVGGRTFTTMAQTLKSESPYFRELIASKKSSAVIFVDRDPKPFEVILAFLRAGFVNCPDLEILGPAIIEANFYGFESFIDFVRQICYRNMHPFSQIADAENLDPGLVDETFPTLEALLDSPFFPAMFREKQQRHKIIFTDMLPAGKRIVYEDPDGILCYREALQLATILDVEANCETIEPMCRVDWDVVTPWKFLDLHSDVATWPRYPGNGAITYTQIVPVSFYMRYITDGLSVNWWLEQHVGSFVNHGCMALFDSLSDGLSERSFPLLEVYHSDGKRSVGNHSETDKILRAYSYERDSDTGQQCLTDFSEIDGFSKIVVKGTE